MPEGFELVRTVRQHLRRSAALLDQGQLDGAMAEADAALALDPQSAPAQALRDRIQAARTVPPAAAPPAARPAPSQGFVPYGVNAASWRGFEQRITERRFRALLETINTSIVAGDGAAARAALDEARELRPDEPILAEFDARVAAVPAALEGPAYPESPASRIWIRAMGAAALFVMGVSLLLGLEWLRPDNTAASAPPPVTAPAVPAVAPTPEPPSAPSPDLGPVPVALNEESVPAILTAPEPLLRPAATTGAGPAGVERTPAPRETPPPARAAPQTAERRTAERRTVEGVAPEDRGGEIPDDFVAPQRTVAALTPNVGPALEPSRAVDLPVTADVRGRAAAPAAEVAAAVAIPAPVDQQRRVEEVLRRYARAYGQLDVGAARAVWPTVDERALARAFGSLSSQSVQLDACDIDIRGVTANAACRGQASYAPKVGNREPRVEARNWRFELRRDGDAWQIIDVNAR